MCFPTCPDNYFTHFLPQTSKTSLLRLIWRPCFLFHFDNRNCQKNSSTCSAHQVLPHALPTKFVHVLCPHMFQCMNYLCCCLIYSNPFACALGPTSSTQGHHFPQHQFLSVLDCSRQHSTWSDISICKQTTLPWTPYPFPVSALRFQLHFTAKLFERGLRHSISIFPLLFSFLSPLQSDFWLYKCRNHSCQGHQWPLLFNRVVIFLS